MDELEKDLEAGCFKTPSDIQKLTEKVKNISSPQELSNEVIARLLRDVLPCMFNAEVQKECVELFELLEPAIPKPQLALKDETTKYMTAVQKLYDTENAYWHRIWCLLLRILGSEISHKDIINAFLKVVERGFRSPQMQRRVESFSCWETLLDVLIKYNDIKKEKRVHLILIPLKGSKAKTPDVAGKKFDIWWNLIQALDESLIDYVDTIDNFLCFCFGPFKNECEPVFSDDMPKTFTSIRNKSIACLGASLGQPSELIIKLGKSHGLDLTKSKQVISKEIFVTTGKIVIAACVEVIPLIAQLTSDNLELAHSIWMSLLCFIGPVNVKKYAKFILECLEKLQTLPKKTDKKLLSLIVEVTTLVLSFDPIISTASNLDLEKCVEFLDDNWKIMDEKQILRLPDQIKFKNKMSPLRRSGRTPTKENNKKTDEFVVIPSVWKLNPEKLTEHQQERMRKRPNDIPALYNDMSQSQDSCSLKAWTPSTVAVIALQDINKELPIVLADTEKKPTKTRAMKEIDRLKIDTVEGAPAINESEKMTTRRRSSTRAAKQKEPEWKKSLISNKGNDKSKGKRTEAKTENEKTIVKNEPQSSSDKGKSSKSPLKSSNQVEQTIKIEPISPIKSPAKQESLGTPDRQCDTEMIECSQDVTPTVNINGRRSRTSFTTSPRRLLPPASPTIPSSVTTTPTRTLRSTSTSLDSLERVEVSEQRTPTKVEIIPTKIEVTVQKCSQDIFNQETPDPLDISMKSPESSPRQLRSANLSPIKATPEKVETIKVADAESRRSPRLSPKVDTTPDRPMRDTTRKIIQFEKAEDLKLVMDDTGNENAAEITSSPEQTLEKTSEFLNDTLNMSPICSLVPKSPISAQICLQERDEMNVSPTLPTKLLRRMESPRSTVPAATTVFQGRAAQMMSMLHKQNASTPIAKSAAVPSELHIEPEMLTFTKTLPGPSASPSNSILKRKIEDSFDENSAKRKRVSFHDPPVSVTKEYVPMEEEIRGGKNGQSRSLSMVIGDSQSPNRLKYTLKRRGKRDLLSPRLSQSEILFKKPESPLPAKEDEPAQLSQEPIASTSENTSQNDSFFNFKNRSEIFDFCFAEGNFEMFLEKMVENGAKFSPKANKIMAKALSNQMDSDPKLCYSILDRFSEKHAKEFLDHAMQENSTADILDRLTLPVLMDYLQEKITANQEVKVELLKKLEIWFADPATITRQEVLTFLANSMPDETTNEELSVILDELFSGKSAVEAFDILTQHIRKCM